MSRTSEEKDLGNWHLYHGHFEAFCSVYQSCSSAARARSILAMVRRNFKRLDCEDLIIGLGHRPISDLMLNMLSIRGLHTSRRIYSVWKSIQRAATRLRPISGFKELSYEQRLRSTGLTTLEERRQRGDLIECYKILTGKANIDPQGHTVLPSLR